jgi:hypothetical protein
MFIVCGCPHSFLQKKGRNIKKDLKNEISYVVLSAGQSILRSLLPKNDPNGLVNAQKFTLAMVHPGSILKQPHLIDLFIIAQFPF